jgi:1-acyl-sn-glycerol-3-phosphate acyltransferase
MLLTSSALSSHLLPITQQANTKRLTRYYRLARIALHTLNGMAIAALVMPLSSKNGRLAIILWWSKTLLRILNVQLHVHGQTPPAYAIARNNLLVANHISWLDIHAINSLLPVRFIAKSDIKSWPLFGYLAKKSQVLFIERGKRQHATRIVDLTTQSLKAGDNVCLFPEGTTTDGTCIAPFKGSVMQSALHAKSTVWPIAIRYPGADGSINTEVAYAGDTTLVESILRVVGQQQAILELHFFTPISLAQQHVPQNRRDLTGHIQQLITKKLKL